MITMLQKLPQTHDKMVPFFICDTLGTLVTLDICIYIYNSVLGLLKDANNQYDHISSNCCPISLKFCLVVFYMVLWTFSKIINFFQKISILRPKTILTIWNFGRHKKTRPYMYFSKLLIICSLLGIIPHHLITKHIF